MTARIELSTGAGWGNIAVSFFLYRLGKPIVYKLVPMAGMLVIESFIAFARHRGAGILPEEETGEQKV